MLMVKAYSVKFALDIFDDVQDIAEIHDIGRLLPSLGPPRRIPTVAGEFELT